MKAGAVSEEWYQDFGHTRSVYRASCGLLLPQYSPSSIIDQQEIFHSHYPLLNPIMKVCVPRHGAFPTALIIPPQSLPMCYSHPEAVYT